MAFGGETIDNYGVVRPFPAVSMLTGLLANALGWRRVEREQHQRLQDRLIFGSRIDREPAGGLRSRDFQTAELGTKIVGWTTRGRPEKRKGGNDTLKAPHLRYRDYFADMQVTVVLRLKPIADTPTLDDLAAALHEPARPLFIGRKPCLPSRNLFRGFIESETVLDALVSAPQIDGPAGTEFRMQWPEGEGKAGIQPGRIYSLTDQRNWFSGLHGGGRRVCEGVALGGSPQSTLNTAIAEEHAHP